MFTAVYVNQTCKRILIRLTLRNIEHRGIVNSFSFIARMLRSTKKKEEKRDRKQEGKRFTPFAASMSRAWPSARGVRNAGYLPLVTPGSDVTAIRSAHTVATKRSLRGEKRCHRVTRARARAYAYDVRHAYASARAV